MKNFCVDFLNNNKGSATEEEKQKFITELKKLHTEGCYVVPIKNGEFKVSNKKPETLEKQIREFDKLIEMTFQKV